MTPYLVLTSAQRDPLWIAARLGKLTSSRVADAFATLKSKGEPASRRNLRVQLALERITGQPQDSGFVSPAMQRGAELEPQGIAAYEAVTGAFVQPVGFLAHRELAAGCSPDGLVGADGLIELKCPGAAVHLDYLKGDIPADYVKQMQHALWITGRAWADFVSFHPAFPPGTQIKVQRVTMTEAERDAHELMVRSFLAEVDREVEAIAAMTKPAEVVA